MSDLTKPELSSLIDAAEEVLTSMGGTDTLVRARRKLMEEREAKVAAEREARQHATHDKIRAQKRGSRR